MPYIENQKFREAIKETLSDIVGDGNEISCILTKPGELNFTISILCHRYIKSKGLKRSIMVAAKTTALEAKESLPKY